MSRLPSKRVNHLKLAFLSPFYLPLKTLVNIHGAHEPTLDKLDFSLGYFVLRNRLQQPHKQKQSGSMHDSTAILYRTPSSMPGSHFYKDARIAHIYIQPLIHKHFFSICFSIYVCVCVKVMSIKVTKMELHQIEFVFYYKSPDFA